MRVFGKDFQLLSNEQLSELLSLEREGAIYTDHWIDALNDFRHVRISFSEPEAREYARRMWAYELWLRAGTPHWARDVQGIDADIATDADSYTLHTKDGKKFPPPYHCIAAFLGSHLESLVCGGKRHTIIQDLGRAALLQTIHRSIDALTPTIRLFNHREKKLCPWEVSCEDDIRDLLYAMLKPQIADLTREESVPSKAGKYRLVDLCSNLSGILIELKWIYKKGDWSKILKQVNDDIQSYIRHPSCKDLIVLIIDAAKDILDPRLMETELSGEQKIDGKLVHISVFVREP